MALGMEVGLGSVHIVLDGDTQLPSRKRGAEPPQILVHGQVTIIFVVSVCLFVCAYFFSAVFDPISIKLGHMLYVWV